MRHEMKPIRLNEQSFNVALLHKALAVFGLGVSPEEVKQQRAGPDTRTKVRALQKRLNVSADDATLVDQATIDAVAEGLKERGLTAASRSFTVTGTVRAQDGSTKSRQRVVAFDLDLRGVKTYRSVQKLSDVGADTGFEFLGQTASDRGGTYRLTFYDWQYRTAERNKADVVVYAIDEGRGEVQVVGRSRLVNSDAYNDKGLVRGLDVILTQTDARTEYEIVMGLLKPFLKESQVELLDLASSPDQVAFTASELEIELTRVRTAAGAEFIVRDQKGAGLSHELLYALGRQNVPLSWPALFKRSDDELRAAIGTSVKARITQEVPEKGITTFLEALRQSATKRLLDGKQHGKHANGRAPFQAMLSQALPKETQRAAFINAVRTFSGKDFREFWEKHLPAQPEFKGHPELVSSLLLTQQLTLLTGNHPPLVKELQVSRNLDSVEKLLDLDTNEWLKIVKKTGVPEFVAGKTDAERRMNYVQSLQNLLTAGFPTQRISGMVRRNELPIEKTRVSRAVGNFLSKNGTFDFAHSRVHDFDQEIRNAVGDGDLKEVKTEIMRLQRVFQVSPDPKAFAGLLESNLTSAHAIASIPRKAFVKTYSKKLGGSAVAFTTHQRAEHVAMRSEFQAMHMWEYAQGATPQFVMAPADQAAAMAVLKGQLPNYAELFGKPSLCECEHCRSVCSAAAYFVDLLRFVWRGEPNAEGKTPLDVLAARRPDLLHLPLTCENTNTVIPYLDLANEVMEYYTAHDSLENFEGYDTGEATEAELRANPQNFDLEAYRKVKDAVYPFTLPYHQPLDVIRTYSDHLNVSRYEALKAMDPQPDAPTANAIAAEALRLSQEEYKVLTLQSFDGVANPTPLHGYYGYGAALELEELSSVPEFLHRTGVKYRDLVELVKTQFINPHQPRLDFLQEIFAGALISASELYTKLKQVEGGTLGAETDPDIVAAIDAYNADHGTTLTAVEFGAWVTIHLGEFRQVITLYEAESKCDLETTKLRTIESIYESLPNSGISDATWSKFHRFIRLWRKLGWTIHETDLMLAALGEADITPTAIGKLESVARLKSATKLSVNQLAVLWGNIDTYGRKSLYGKLFLNKAVQQIDDAFRADAWGNFLQDPTEKLADHQSAILAAFRIREEDLAAILSVAYVIDGGVRRPISLQADALSLANLSTIYRHVALAKALKVRVADGCKIITLFGAWPFSTWDLQLQAFVEVAPEITHDFSRLVDATKAAGFKAPVLDYMLTGAVAADSKIGLDKGKTRQAAKAVREAFSAIEQEHPETPPTPLTKEVLAAKLAVTFQPDAVARFINILDGTATFERVADSNLNIAMPDALSEKYAYVKASGRLTCTGIPSDDEQATLKGLANATAAFKAAVDELYSDPETFIVTQFTDVFTDLVDANKTLLNHPTQATPATLEERLAYTYERFIPILKRKLRRDTVTQQVGAAIGLGETTAALLVAQDLDALVADLSQEGFSAAYFSDATWTALALQRTDEAIDFDWGTTAPDPLVPADSFSARWEAYLAAPASGEYTLRVDTDEPDEGFRLYLDGALILEKLSGDAMTSWEALVKLNAAQMHLLRLDYAEAVQNAGVRLFWKTATTAPEIIPASVAYPAAVVEGLAATTELYHRAAKFVTGFKLSDAEVNHLMNHGAEFGGLDFKAIAPAAWRRISDYCALRNKVPQAQAFLTDVFALAHRAEPAPTLPEVKELLQRATAWDVASLAFLVDTEFGLAVADFRNEIALTRLRDVMRIVAKTGLSAETVADWGAAETDFDILNDTAQLVKKTVKAKYEEADWLELAGGLSDKVREHQREALIGYLLTRPAIRAWGAEDADGLFEYFLIDCQMGACMDTSRIVQANAAVQMFVNRGLLNLESDATDGPEKGVSPGAIDKDRWEWMKNYRVWEANRKVFLYPENWLEPEWRNDRSPFFRELESYLVQNDITERSVEQAFRNYLASLNEVANLEVCGLLRENYEDGNLKFLHVFGRTHNAPYKFFYRRWNEYRKWSAWESVKVDVRCVEHDDHVGVHLVPVVWKNRLFLFWPEFREVQEEPAGNSNESIEQVADDAMGFLKPERRFEVKLAWSEYVNGQWTPKQLSKEFVKLKYASSVAPDESAIRFTTGIDAENQLTISLFVAVVWDGTYGWWSGGHFELADITSSVEAKNPSDGFIGEVEGPYANDFMKGIGNSKLQWSDDVYLNNSTRHSLLLALDEANLSVKFDNPFFFSDRSRTYFVRPVDIAIVEGIKSPGLYIPGIEGLVDTSGFLYDVIPPRVGPDDYIPAEVVTGGFDPRATVTPFALIGGAVQAAGGVVPHGARAGVVSPAGTGAARAPTRVASAAGGAGAVSLMTRTAAQPTAGVTPAPASGGEAMVRGMTTRSGSAAMAMEADEAFMGTSYAMSLPQTMAAFGGVKSITKISAGLTLRLAKGLEFHTFYHPFSGAFVENLNRGGISRGNKPAEFPAGLMESDTTIPSDDGTTFESAYAPNFANQLVQHPADFATRTYYKENVCFDAYGANSLYNWELFFHAPLYIATRLSKNGKYQEAMKWFHYIFDPTTDKMPGPGESETSRYWNVPPFKTTPAESLEDWFKTLLPNSDPNTENAIIAEWRDHPFDPHLVASNRPLAYMKNVVIKYVENLLTWGDSLFRQFTRESVNEALRIYVIANHILGPRPETIPTRGNVKAESYASLESKWDDFSNALVELENIFPFSSEAPVSDESTGPNLLGVGAALYFCIPPNEKLTKSWDTAADRLFKIRHCQDIDGVERRLALFAPPIDPGALIQATSQGLSLGSILADLSSPPPNYRFSVLIQKANEFCGEVKALGGALLAVLEKKDAEELGRLRASHETHMLELVTAVKERQVLEAKANREGVLKSRDTARVRLQHYVALLGTDSVKVPAIPTISATLTADSQLPGDTSIPTIKVDADEGLVASGETGLKVIGKEKEQLDKHEAAKFLTAGAGAAEALAAGLALVPQIGPQGMPFGVGVGAWWGGQNLGAAASAVGKALAAGAKFLSDEAAQAATVASFIRREQDWTLQANLAAKEITQLDKQITSADIRLQVAQKELENHNQQIENGKEVELFLQDKFTNQELYQWMKEQLFAVYKQSYDLAFDMAKKAEKAYNYEMGTETASFIQYGYWESSKQGLAAGEKLQLALRRLEKAYLEENRRELELTKSISLARLNPVALIQLRETGRCFFSVPEEVFDVDYRGHYFRRIKSVRISLPCVAGPYTTVNCSLRLLNNTVRVDTSMNEDGNYEHANDEGLFVDDERFRTNRTPVTSIVTSTAENDAGMFEFNFRDDRLLPFERAGAISDWQVELSTDKELRQFDHSTISDVVLHMSYTARETGGLMKEKATAHMKEFLTNAAELMQEPLKQMFSLKHEFPTEWYNFLHPAEDGGEQVLNFVLNQDRFPFFVQERSRVLKKIEVFAKCKNPEDYEMILSYVNGDGDTVDSGPITLAPNPTYGGLNKATIGETDFGLSLDEVDLTLPLSVRLKRSTAGDYTALATGPEDEVEDALMVVHYRLE